MKTIEDYTNYCTLEQTNKAIKLGCPCYNPDDYNPIKFPTTQQMIGWLCTKKLYISINADYVDKESNTRFYSYSLSDIQMQIVDGVMFHSQKDAEIAAIDMALDCLEDEE